MTADRARWIGSVGMAPSVVDCRRIVEDCVASGFRTGYEGVSRRKGKISRTSADDAPMHYRGRSRQGFMTIWGAGLWGWSLLPENTSESCYKISVPGRGVA